MQFPERPSRWIAGYMAAFVAWAALSRRLTSGGSPFALWLLGAASSRWRWLS